MSAKCRSCAAPMVWVRVRGQTGTKAMPLDADEHGAPLLVKGGNIHYSGVIEPDGTRIAELRKADPTKDGMRSHFASCKDADSWRKK